MGALPSTDMEGYKSLRERVDTSLKLCKEESSVDFKRADVWNVLKDIIIRTSLAMSNQRDGGIIIIGVEESEGRWNLTGMQPEQLSTYDPDAILDQVNLYAAPEITLDIVIHKDEDKKQYLIIQVNEFVEQPIVCKKDGNDRKGNMIFKVGAVYVRPIGKAETTEVKNDRQMHDLLELSSEKMARKFLEKCGRVGIEISRPGNSDDNKHEFDKELAGL